MFLTHPWPWNKVIKPGVHRVDAKQGYNQAKLERPGSRLPNIWTRLESIDSDRYFPTVFHFLNLGWWRFPRVRGFLEECSTIHSGLRFFFFFFFFKVEIISRTLIPLFRPGSVYSGSASWDDSNRVFPDELRVSSFPDRFPTLLDSGIVSPLRLRWVKGVCVFTCNLPPALLAEWPGSFTCNCSNTGMERTPNQSQHTHLTLEQKIFPPLLPGFELTTIRSRVRHSANTQPWFVCVC